MAKKLSPALQREIIGKGAEGQSARQIAAWLLKEHKLKVSHQAVGNVLRATRSDRATVVKEIVREKLGTTVTSDIDRLDVIRRQVAKRARSLDSDLVREWTALKRLESDILDRKIHYSGADAPEPSGASPGVHVFLPAETEE